ncbi:hypothetical protein B0T20DRAFT_452276 [Sordaria brevicollis]|uniref:Coiled-coil domain-containing protein n=1 Tax=Sordaria brevicollis TaxID=83679 RepID=A0AAE0PHQ9_SORBR|nr:hypothetical protein B0T20DRAFT_452276 [Sordaria brevicollis]
MAGKKGQDNSKKAAGQARKADAAAQKAAAEQAKKDAAEAADFTVFGPVLCCSRCRFCLPGVGGKGYPRSAANSVPSCDISCLPISRPIHSFASLALRPARHPYPCFPKETFAFRQERLSAFRSRYSMRETDTLVGWGWTKAFTNPIDPRIGTDYVLLAREAEAAKKAEAARKKAEKEALLREEEKNTPGRSQPKNAKTAVKKTRGLDLSQLDDDGSGPLSALNASGIDNALDALSLTSSSNNDKIDRHPERRFKAAYAAFEERRLAEMEKDGSGQGLRLNQKKEKIKKEFEKHPDNPFNQVTARYDATKEELAQLKEQERQKIEARLGGRR